MSAKKIKDTKKEYATENTLKVGDKVYSLKGCRIARKQGIIATGKVVKFCEGGKCVVQKDTYGSNRSKYRVFLTENLRKGKPPKSMYK